MTADTTKLTGATPVPPVADLAEAIDPAEPIRTTPWGARQFSVLDNSGNRLIYVEYAP